MTAISGPFDKISVCLPAYRGTAIIRPVFDALLAQTHKDFEIIVGNDSVEDHEAMEALIASYRDSRIVLIKNRENLGYPRNIQNIVAQARNEIMFFMCQDDHLRGNNIFARVLNVFNQHLDVGVIARPYYWYIDDINMPIRVIPKCDKRIISIRDDEKYLNAVLSTVGQLSGLVMRKSLITHNFNEHIFPSHIYPFLSVMKTHKCYFWEDFMLGVCTKHSQTKLSKVYSPSPTWTWVKMFNTVLPESEFEKMRRVGIERMTKECIGLVQIKNYGYFSDLMSDIFHHVKSRPKNLLSPVFWFFVIGVMVTPRAVLRWMVDFYKLSINRYKLKNLLSE